jgi:hypothetical protein
VNRREEGYEAASPGAGLGASHQTGWTSLVVRCLDELARARLHRGAYGTHLPSAPPILDTGPAG